LKNLPNSHTILILICRQTIADWIHIHKDKGNELTAKVAAVAPTKPKRRIPQTFMSSSTAILIHKTPLQLLPSSFAPFWVEFTDRRMAEVRASKGFHGGGMARVLIPDSLDFSTLNPKLVSSQSLHP
jgi:hypothetical protein